MNDTNIVSSRDDLGKLYQIYYLTGHGVEVGVHYGQFSKEVSKHWTGKIYCVDIWESDSLYEGVSRELSSLGFRVLRGKSDVIASVFEDNYFDWVYIDADHSYDSVKQDYNAWYPKVRNGGIISGHDYDNEPGVNKFVNELGKDIMLTSEKNIKSWYFIKNE